MRRRNAIPRNKREAQARERTLAAIAAMRREGLSQTAAAKAYGTDSRTMHRYAGSTLRKTSPHGRYAVSSYDRLARTLRVPALQAEPFTVRDSRTASRIAIYANAIGAYASGNASALKQFEGKSFRAVSGPIQFVTDPNTLDNLLDADELHIDKLYLETIGPQP
jgi:hypothetical protein